MRGFKIGNTSHLRDVLKQPLRSFGFAFQRRLNERI